MTAVTEWPWPTSTVGAQFEIQLGKMLDAARNVGEPKRYLGNRAVQWGRIDLSAAGIVPLTPQDQARFRLKMNDLLVCEGGEVGRAAIWREQLHECYYQKALHRLRPKSGYDPRIMLALLEYWSSTNGFINFVTQTSIAHLPCDKFLTMPLPLIPETEQERLGDVLDDLNSLISALEHMIAKKQTIKQGMMQQLLTGKTRLPGFGSSWREVRLGEVGTFLKGRGIKRDDVLGAGVPCIRYGELYTAFTDYTSRTLSFVERGVSATALPIRTGDLLFAGSGETREEIGKCVAYTGIASAVAGGDIIVLRGTTFNPVYLAMLTNTATVAAQKAKRGQGDAVVHISSRALGDIELRLPSKDEQDAITTVLTNSDDEIRLLRYRLAKAKAMKQGMMQELLTGRTRLPVEEGAA